MTNVFHKSGASNTLLKPKDSFTKFMKPMQTSKNNTN